MTLLKGKQFIFFLQTVHLHLKFTSPLMLNLIMPQSQPSAGVSSLFCSQIHHTLKESLTAHTGSTFLEIGQI